jgi:hypothetical protein
VLVKLIRTAVSLAGSKKSHGNNFVTADPSGPARRFVLLRPLLKTIIEANSFALLAWSVEKWDDRAVRLSSLTLVLGGRTLDESRRI